MKLARIISVMFVTLTCVVLAQAQSDRTFVSAHGSDNSDCGSSDLPCRTFAFALGKTNAGGEVIALDSGIYDNSSIFITKSMTLSAAPGAHVELFNTNGNGINVSAATSDTVVVRNLYLSRQSGADTTTTGFLVNSVGTLHIENCVVSGFGTGINIDVSASLQSSIQDTIIRDSSLVGIFVAPSAGVTRVSIDRCRLQNTAPGAFADGLQVFAHARVTVRDSTASGNTGAGFRARGGDMNIENCQISNNDVGVAVSTLNTDTPTVTVSNSIVTNNRSFGFQQSNTGVFHSLGNNVVRRNGTNTAGTITVITGT